jgi:hypothetical protein
MSRFGPLPNLQAVPLGAVDIMTATNEYGTTRAPGEESYPISAERSPLCESRVIYL